MRYLDLPVLRLKNPLPGTDDQDQGPEQRQSGDRAATLAAGYNQTKVGSCAICGD